MHMSNYHENESGALHVAIIGTGSAAFAAAIQASKSGARVSMIEMKDTIGGTCVNIGCVPSKILINAAKIAQETKQSAFPALKISPYVLDRSMLASQIQNRVDELRLAKYESILEDNPSIKLINGRAKFLSSKELQIELNAGGTENLVADKILIATGSRPNVPKIDGLENTPYLTSTEALFTEVTPESLIVVGASVVALEIAQAFLRLGTQVSLIARTTLLSHEEESISDLLMEELISEGMKIHTFTELQLVTYTNGKFECITSSGSELKAEKLLIATGRQANTDQLNLKSAGVDVDNQGRVIVGNDLQTSQKDIFAAGDCTQLPQFVYVAAAAGTRAGKNMVGGDEKLDISTLPTVVFTDPQVATVGLDVAQAQKQGINVVARKLDLEHVPRALANFKTNGFIQLVADAETMQIIGAQIIADVAGEMIQTVSIAIAQGMTVQALADTLFPYLTQVEGLKLCAQTFTQDVSQLSCCAG
ncbi:Mercuric reductase [Hydrogenovibrio crunogenus]|uniref:Mercuric reductase n=1 Tax=Hydrogenovibrio crunogenus TaxID=39765 RepID=A0A4P7P298_9GAMM|nr:mercury(II) reductase [Hydrogenovibrio crunogenus]QBZ84156.1 Mercuric reductase [Hydrogenovibrio crunogenus]